MVHLETVEELAESLADLVGDHPADCKCRICFVSNITERIQQAVKNDVFLANMKELSKVTEDR